VAVVFAVALEALAEPFIPPAGLVEVLAPTALRGRSTATIRAMTTLYG